MQIDYKCPTCGATKSIVYQRQRDISGVPETVVCGVRGCEDEQVRVKK